MRASSLSRVLSVCVDRRRPAFIWGPPGVGKSDVVAQLAESKSMQLRDIRLNLLDPVDLKGFPVPNHETKQMSWYPPDFLPPMFVRKEQKVRGKIETALVPNDSRGILFLDELVAADRAVQAAAYQLMLNFRIGDYVLPEGWSIVAAGNRAGDRSVVHSMPAALANRLVHFDFDVNLDDFSTWAVAHGIKSEVLAFLRFRSNLLHSFDPKTNPRAFPSPRSWMFVNDLIGQGMTNDEEFETVKGTVGEGAASEFAAFIRIARDLPTVDEVLFNPKKAPVPESPSALYAMATSLAERASRDNYERLMEYINRVPTEFQVVFTRDAVKRCDDVSKTAAFTKWSVANSDVMI